MKKKYLFIQCAHTFMLALVFIFSAHSLASALTFTWSGSPIVGENPAFTPSGTAQFDVAGSQLTITLTDTSNQTLTAIGQALSGLTWDITGPSVSLSGVNALIALGSNLVGSGSTSDTDLSGEWGFKDNLLAGSSAVGPLGSYGISAVGDVNMGVDTFGAGDRFDTSSNLFPPPSGSLNGIEGAIVSQNVDLTSGGFTTQGPVVQDTMIFTFNITGTLNVNDITNVQPLFGTDGATLVPEPSTLLLLGSGLVGLVGLMRKKTRV